MKGMESYREREHTHTRFPFLGTLSWKHMKVFADEAVACVCWADATNVLGPLPLGIGQASRPVVHQPVN